MDTTQFLIDCKHCGNRGLMEVLAEKSLIESFEDDDPNSIVAARWDAGYIYQILRCYACRDITVYQLSIHTGVDPECIDRSADRTLYPSEGERPLDVPARIQAEWDAAIRVRRINQNAFAVLLGRVLDAICIDQKADGKDLYHRIEDLASSGKLPQGLKDVAHGLRKLRNFGAHGNYGDLDPKDAPLLESLCRTLLTYLYTLPALIQDGRKRLEEDLMSPSSTGTS